MLEKIGTNNFAYALKAAIKQEEIEERLKLWRETLSEFAMEIESQDGRRYIESYDYTKNDPSEDLRPADTDTVQHFYRVTEYGWIYLYADSEAEISDEEDPEDTKRREWSEHRTAGLKDAAEQAYELRREFVLGVSNSVAKKHLAEIVEYVLMSSHRGKWWDVTEPEMNEVLGIEFVAEDEPNKEQLTDIVQKSPERALLLTAYCADLPSR